MSEEKKSDPLATKIADSVIAEAVKSVERITNHTAEASPAPAGQPPAPADPAEVQALKQQLLEVRQTLRQREAELEASQAMGRETLDKLKDQHERLLRAAADQENYKKRAAKERDEVAKFGQEKLLREVLPVLDNLDRALDHAKSAADFDGLKSGLQMTRKLFEDTLGKFGVKSFSAVNQPFDPNRHEAMQAVESDAPANTVVQELVRGYTLHERLMRPAMVVVARPRAEAAAQPEKAPEPAKTSEGEKEPNSGGATPAA